MLNNLAATTPETCITAVKWRKSRNSGRPWLRPEMLQQELQNKDLLAKRCEQGLPGVSDEAASARLAGQ